MCKIRAIAIETASENMAFLPRGGGDYGAEQFLALRKIEICHGAHTIQATLALLDDPALLKPGELGLGAQAFRRLGLAEGSGVSTAQARPPASIKMVRRKIGGETLSPPDFAAIIRDISRHL